MLHRSNCNSLSSPLTYQLLTSPLTLSWDPKLLPVILLPSSRYSVASAVGGLVSSPLCVLIRRVLSGLIAAVFLPLVAAFWRKAALRVVELPPRAMGRSIEAIVVACR